MDTYKEIRTFRYENAIVRVHIPDLSKEESVRRMKAIHKAAADLLTAPKITDNKTDIKEK